MLSDAERIQHRKESKHKYYMNHRNETIQRVTEYRRNHPDKVKEYNKTARLNEKMKMYMEIVGATHKT